MNCVPGALETGAVGFAVPGTTTVARVVAAGAAAVPAAPPRSFWAALSLGWASPNPQPPSRSCATMGPAHLPDLNPQHPESQPASLVQTEGTMLACGTSQAEVGLSFKEKNRRKGAHYWCTYQM